MNLDQIISLVISLVNEDSLHYNDALRLSSTFLLFYILSVSIFLHIWKFFSAEICMISRFQFQKMVADYSRAIFIIQNKLYYVDVTQKCSTLYAEICYFIISHPLAISKRKVFFFFFFYNKIF
jgi:hypothetical protein